MGKQGRQAGLGQITTRLKLAGKYGSEATSSPLVSGMCGVPGWVKGTLKLGQGDTEAESRGHQGWVRTGDVTETSLLRENQMVSILNSFS